MSNHPISKDQRIFNSTNRCPRCKRWIWYTTTYEPNGRVRRVFNPTDPASLVECRKCHQRWFYFDQAVAIELEEVSRSSEAAFSSQFVLDNRKGKSPLLRRRTVTEEWEQVYTIENELTETTGANLELSLATFGKLTLSAEQSLKERYSISEKKKRVYTEELEIEVPTGVLRTYSLNYKRMWQHGKARIKAADDALIELPFRVVVDLTLDVSQVDSS